MLFFFFFKQKTAYELRISDWSSDVCSSDLIDVGQNNACTERNDCPGDLRNGESDDRRNQEQDPIGRRWDDGFLKEYLRAISKTLKQTKRPDHLRAPSQCHRCPDFPDSVDAHRNGQHERERDQKNAEQGGHEQPKNKPKQKLNRKNE